MSQNVSRPEGTGPEKWWHKPLTVIQTNMQVRDALKIKPEVLAEQIFSLEGDALLFNVGGIYAWYPTEVKYHNRADFLQTYPTLLEELIDACHKKGLRFIARFDFSAAEDYVYGDHPDWFARWPDRTPAIVGQHRPGGWPLLYKVCFNSDYHYDAVALPAMREALSRYAIDGVFLNRSAAWPCWCDRCRRKYLETFGTPMPDDPSKIDPRWAAIQYKEGVERYEACIKGVSPEIPLILYHMYKTVTCDCFDAEIICEEAANPLSEGLSQAWQPYVRMKSCDVFSTGSPAWGYVHSAPGLDWRHTGLPPADYRYWLSQIPANGSTLVHSITGVPDTIEDKRILDCVKWANVRAHRVYPSMTHKKPFADVAVLINEALAAPENEMDFAWAHALTEMQTPFALLIDRDVQCEKMQAFRVIVVPNGYHFTRETLAEVEAYVASGGNMLFEGAIRDEDTALYTMCGVEPYGTRSALLDGCYFRSEPAGAFLNVGGLERTLYTELRGQIFYCKPSTAKTLATHVPPFVPANEAYTPPERASLPVPHTDIPVCLENKHEKGTVIMLTFDLAALYSRYGICDHLTVMRNIVRRLIGTPAVQVTPLQGLYVSLLAGQDGQVLHLTNGAGRRPLENVTPLLDIDVTLKAQNVVRVTELIEGEEIPFVCDETGCHFKVDRLDVWKCFHVQYA